MLSGRKPRSKPLARAALTAASFVLAVFACLGFGHAVHAQVASNDLLPGEFGNAIGLTTTDIRVTIANIIRIALGLLGTIALLLILYAGFIWMTAGGDQEKVSRAKKILSSALIGLLIIMASFAITSFVISRLLGATEGGGPGGTSAAPPDDNACIGLSATCPAGALGNGIVESHYPGRSATGIPRNTRIAVTFKKPIDPASLVVGPNGSVAIVKSVSIANATSQFPTKFAQSLTADAIDVVPAGDGKTFVFTQKNCPTDCFGSPSEDVWYTVALRGGTDGVKLEGGAPAFTGTFSSGYLWEFQVSTALDLTPPKVTYVEPLDGGTDVARNSIIQVNFSEAVDPVSLSGGLSVTAGGDVIRGAQLIGNAYRALEFRTDDACGVNSCGEQVFCLPGNKDIRVDVKADPLSAPPSPLGVYPPTAGITDMSGNSLDGNGDGVAQGPTQDDHPFSFRTNDQVDLTPPKVVAQEPAILAGGIARDVPVSATFSKLMSTASITTDTMRLVPGTNPPANFTVTSGALASVAGGKLDETKAVIQHDLFAVNSTKYGADMTSGLRDLQQNCFYPGGAAGGGTGSDCTDPSKPYCCNGKPYATAAEAASGCGFAP